MNRLSIYLFAAAIVITGCKKNYDDTINGQKPDARIAAAMAAYQTKLTSAPYGWIVLETTTGTAFNQGVSQAGPVAAFAYYMSFTDSNKVTMFSDFDTSMAAVPKTSDFRVKSLQRPALIFDTYSYLHVPCDPDPAISKSPFGPGYGWGTDFEFSFADNIDPSKLGDTIRLTGNLNSASAVMVQATKEQRDAYYAGGLKTTILSFGNILNYFKRVSAGATQFELTPSLGGAKSLDINWLDGSANLQSITTSVYFTSTAVNLVNPPTIGNQTINSFNNVVWNAGTSTITTSINGTTAATITGSSSPLKNDPNAPFTWWNKPVTNGNVYWVSETNFHINGVDDALKVSSLAGYSGFTLFWPQYGVNRGVHYDALIPITSDAINYAGAYGQPIFSAGTVVFPLLGTFGTIPSGDMAIFTSLIQKFAEPTGYYLILKEDKITYDMVNVADARSWITWIWVF